MAYPDEIITRLSTSHHLSAELQEQLKNRLMLGEIRAVVEAGAFAPENLLLQVVLPQEPAVPYVTVLSASIAKSIISDKLALDALRVYATNNAKEWVEWQLIKYEILQLQQLKTVNERVKRARVLTDRTLVISEFLTGNDLVKLDYADIAMPLLQYRSMSTKPIKEAATSYFQQLFKDAGREILNVDFAPKEGNGIQLGVRMIIIYREQPRASSAAAALETSNKRIVFYIKTHQEGSTSQSSSKKPVDPKELFVYKLLEYIGYGPKAYFFSDPLSAGSGFYIATQDVAFTKVDRKIKTFSLFDKMKGDYNASPGEPQHDDARRALIALDILSRLMRLDDTTTNPGNFGRTDVEYQGIRRCKWKLIDFRVPPARDAYYYSDVHIYEGFAGGNGRYNYDYADFLLYLFKDKTFESQKIAIAHTTMAELRAGRSCQSRADDRKMPFIDAIKRAQEYIVSYLQENYKAMHLDLRLVLNDLQQYVSAICTNFSHLETGIAKTYEELERERATLPCDAVVMVGSTDKTTPEDKKSPRP